MIFKKTDKNLLVENVKRNDFWADKLAWIFTQTEPFFKDGDVFSVLDRWKYGMKNMGYDFTVPMPEVSAKYKGSSTPKSKGGSAKSDSPKSSPTR